MMTQVLTQSVDQLVEASRDPIQVVLQQSPTDPSTIALLIASIVIGPLAMVIVGKMQVASARSASEAQTDQAKFALAEQAKVARDVAELGFRGTVISESRQKWIESTRQALSKYISHFDYFYMKVRLHNSDDKKISPTDLPDLMSDLYTAYIQTVLLLDPEIPSQQALITLMDEMSSKTKIQEVKLDPNAYEEAKKTLISSARTMFSVELNRARSGV